MFCSNCGTQLDENARFCGKCGNPVKATSVSTVTPPPISNPNPLSANPSIMQDAPSNTNAIDTIITKNIEYYSNQFHAIETGNKAKLNWASFFLSYFHAAYRSMWREWLTYMRLPLIATAVSTLLVSWGISSFLSSFNFTVIIIGAIISLISYIFTFTKGILYARDFNKLYKHHVEKKIGQNNLTSDISLKNALIALVIALVISGLLTGLISTSLTFSLLGENDSEYSDSSYAYEDSIVYEEPIVKSNDSPIFSFEEESPTATPSTPVNIHDYLGTWAIDSMDTESSFATITLNSRNDYFFLTVDGVFQNGNKMIWIENVELRFDGVQAQGEYYEDGWGNHGFITLKFNDQHIYFSITCEGDGWYGMTASEERCSRYEQNVSKDLSFDTVNFHDYLGDWVIEDLYTESNFAILTLDTRNDYPYVSVYYSYDNGSEDFGNGVFWIDTVAVSFDGVTAQGDYYLPEKEDPLQKLILQRIQKSRKEDTGMSEVRLITPITRQDAKKTQVAAYCRVSSNSADQLNSYAAQIRAYKKLIGERKEWELVDIFADEGLTGTKSETRDEFQRMIRMCELKQIDLIVTKSISRFARNTKDALAYVRKLKLLGVGVQFEKEGISTLSMGDEMLLNTFAALAQEESQAISMNQRLSIVKRMELGEYVDSNAPYGYRLVDKALAVYEPEAAIVRNIFTLYLRGFSTSEIARELNKLNIPTKAGKETWRPSRVAYILKNERYIGDSFYQKTYRETTAPFNQHTNRGQEDRFYAKGTHPAIIEKDVFDTVQKLIEKRKDAFSRTTTQNIYPLTSRIQCSECGSFYRRRIVSGTVKWVCAVHKDDSTACDSNYYSEERIYDGFITMVNKLRFSEDNILAQVINRLEMALAAMKRNNLAARDLSKSIAELNAKLLTLPPSPHTSPSVNRAGSYFIPRQKRRSRWTMEVTKVPKKIVTVIEPKRSMTVDKEKYRQKRVAAYCRVSTDSEEQLVSYANQKKVYTEMIASRKDWCFAGLFADEGKSGTRADKRPEFNKMINDCLAGKIDYIITKSVSRFARNTVDCLDYVRMLKSKGIGIYFEEQQIDTLKTDSELYLVIYAGFAQSESESISKNITWSVRKKFGKFLFPLFGVRKMNYYFNM